MCYTAYSVYFSYVFSKGCSLKKNGGGDSRGFSRKSIEYIILYVGQLRLQLLKLEHDQHTAHLGRWDQPGRVQADAATTSVTALRRRRPKPHASAGRPMTVS